AGYRPGRQVRHDSGVLVFGARVPASAFEERWGPVVLDQPAAAVGERRLPPGRRRGAHAGAEPISPSFQPRRPYRLPLGVRAPIAHDRGQADGAPKRAGSRVRTGPPLRPSISPEMSRPERGPVEIPPGP